jgi:polysaccharide export outer membrane protein
MRFTIRSFTLVAAAALATAATGCSTVGSLFGINTPSSPLTEETKALRDTVPLPAPVPHELAKELFPPHVVEPGDTLLVQPAEFDAPVRLPPDQPVMPDGTIDLGKYGRPVVAGKTLPQIEVVVRDVIKVKEKDAVAVTVRLIGRASKVYYVLGEVNAPGAFPITCRETVLDAVIAAGGLNARASQDDIVLARPTPEGCRAVLPVCWTRIAQQADPRTNYQIQPGDRVFVPSKRALEGMLPSRCKKPGAACLLPQSSCFGGGCGYVPPAIAPVVVPTVVPAASSSISAKPVAVAPPPHTPTMAPPPHPPTPVVVLPTLPTIAPPPTNLP